MNTDKIYAESIVNEYSVKDTSKVMALKKLDKKAKLPSNIFAYTCGITSSLLLGVGMCLCMGQIGNGKIGAFVLGMVIGILGITGCSLTYPIHKVLKQKGKDKYAADIMLLAKDIAEQD